MQSIAFNLFFFWLLRVINVHDIYCLVSVFLSPKVFKNATEFGIVSIVLFVGYSKHVARKGKPLGQKECLY